MIFNFWPSTEVPDRFYIWSAPKINKSNGSVQTDDDRYQQTIFKFHRLFCRLLFDYICLLFLLLTSTQFYYMSQNQEYHSIPSGRISWCLITLDRIDYILPSVYSGYAGMITCDLDYMCALCMWNYWDSLSLFLMNFDRKYISKRTVPPTYKIFFLTIVTKTSSY